jgi:hypothetical protein
MSNVVCSVCFWSGDAKETFRAPHPFNPNVSLTGCPRCKNIDTMGASCDVQGCRNRNQYVGDGICNCETCKHDKECHR